MPDYHAILAYYQAVADCLLSGALPDEARAAAQPQKTRAIARFLYPDITCWPGTSVPQLRQIDLMLGDLRFRRWERANPDIVAALWRRAESRVVKETLARNEIAQGV